jgi:RNA polymerase sigma-70 factor (ECF subfamily)
MVLGNNTGTCASVNLSEMPGFPTTRLSLVLAVAAEPDAQYDEALGALCEIYWQPLYAFIRRRGYGHEAAQDLTQSFIARLLEKKVLREFQQERGRFARFCWHRSRISWRMKGMPNRRRNEAAPRTGPDRPDRASDDTSPDAIFEKQWAVALVNRCSPNSRRSSAEKESRSFRTAERGLTGDEPRAVS